MHGPRIKPNQPGQFAEETPAMENRLKRKLADGALTFCRRVRCDLRLVRIGSRDGHLTARVLDGGAQGLMIPLITSAAEAEARMCTIAVPRT
jgi:hypothetical protein